MKIINCPYCGGDRVQKRGTRNGCQRMQCIDCKGTKHGGWFTVNPKTGEIVNKIKDKDQEKKLIKLLKQDAFTIEYLSDSTGLLPNEVRQKIQELEENKYNIQYTDGHVSLAKQMPTGNKTKLNIDYWKGDKIKLGLIADTHLCSTFERMEALNCIYDIFAGEKIELVYHGGNYIDGECRFNQYHLHTRGVTPQVEYFVNNYPKRKGILTKFVAGDDHEGWYIQRERLNIGEYTQMKAEKAGRNDLEYIGYVEADVYFEGLKGGSWMRVMHGGGGTAYALSYTPQKIVESLQGGEKPRILLLGHYHKLDWCFPREVHCIQMGCTQDQTPWMRKKKIQAHVGAEILELILAPDGTINRVKLEYITFFDKGFYIGNDKYWR